LSVHAQLARVVLVCVGFSLAGEDL
jgi:hypothetical protein